MASYRVAASTLALGIYDIIGCDGTEFGFIQHVGLSESSGAQTASKIPVLDMGPPLHHPGFSSQIAASVVGSAGLTDDEVQKIKTFVDRHAGEHEAFQQFSKTDVIRFAPQMYCVCPHASPLHEVDGRYARTRFSCSGFVFEAYKKARIELVDLSTLPMVDESVLALAYPELRLMQSASVSRNDLRLGGVGPWPVLLCGYLIHALNRDEDTIRDVPYSPSIEDRRFK